VTNQPFRRTVEENTDNTLLCAWRNDTRVDYLLHILRLDYRTFQLALAVQRHHDIETRFDRRLDQNELLRFIDDPLACIRLWVGQVQDSG
ncbi:MAG: hypothetical protein FWC40_09220, partial [Proteobacteria bacterium]|nr:hypothetical protein [Pseudomonadota bacterium]